ncbi:ankyrin-1-like [Leptopilina boulardi]|uniref:ankyrin-1-like n=1 Tax=Leptopilina boulardi TaxID=63433 RepID=UPI0021F55C0B|nr:ankyrin-1-like [Leptopilina boulardi]
MMHNVREISRQMQMASIARIQQIFAGDVTNQFKNAVRRNDEARINELITQKTSLVRDKFSNDTFLHIVAKDGTPEAAIRLLQLGSDVHARNLEGKTPIFYALKHSAPMIRAFLNNAEIIQKNNYTLLLDALVIGSEEIVGVILNKCLIKIAEYSLQNVISPTRLQSDFCEFQNTEDLINSILRNRFQLFLEEQDYVPFIFFVAKIGRTDILQLILNECRVVLNAKGKNKVTPLHLAVIAQLPEVVLFLLENGANPNCQIQKQITPLHIAAFLQNEEICELLLNFRADCNIGSFDIGYPLHLVCGSNYGQVLKKRLNQTFLNMFDSCKTFDEKTINRTIMKLLLENGANPEFQSRYLELPLLYACRCDRLEEVKLLLEFGANVRAVDSQGNSALHHACIGNAFEIVRMLLEQGVDIETKNQRNHTPFVFSLNSSLNLKMLEFLVDNGANVNAEFSSGLYEALRCSSPDVVEYLLELGK